MNHRRWFAPLALNICFHFGKIRRAIISCVNKPKPFVPSQQKPSAHPPERLPAFDLTGESQSSISFVWPYAFTGQHPKSKAFEKSEREKNI